MTAFTCPRCRESYLVAAIDADAEGRALDAWVCLCDVPELPMWRLWTPRQYACAAFLCAVPVLAALTVWAVVRQAVGA